MPDQDQPPNEDKVTIALIRAILELPHDRRLMLLDQVEKIRLSSTDPSTDPSTDEEGRTWHRQSYGCYINFYDGDRSFWGLSQNISTGGMFIETDQSFATGNTITVLIPNPREEKTLKVPSKIVHITEKGIGVEFIKNI